MTAEHESKIRKWFGRVLEQESAPIEPMVMTLKKAVGDTVLVHVDIEGMQLSNYVGFRLKYPSDIIGPAKVAGSDKAVLYDNGDVFPSGTVETVCNSGYDLDGTKWIYVSKVVKDGEPAECPSGRIVTLQFSCLAQGTGTIEVYDRKYGNSVSGDGYDSDSEPLTFELASDEPAPIPKAIFKIVIE